MGFHKSIIIALLFNTLLTICTEEIDLESFRQEFVVVTKQILLPEFPHAFNPSIIEWNNKILMSFRVIPDPKQSFTSYIGLVWLDKELNPISKPVILDLRSPECKAPSRAEDARLVAADGRLYLVYSDNEDLIISRKGFRMYVAQLATEHDEIHIKTIKKIKIEGIEKLSDFDGCEQDQREKNWVPFEHNKQLLLAYSLDPHIILKPLLNGTEFCQTICSTNSNITWDWGQLRGGTPALRYNDHYLAFFHSSKLMTSVHNPKQARHYFIGAYIFQATLPFTITHMSPFPIIGNNFYHGATYKPYWGTIVAVFPCGFIDHDDYLWLSYGRQDHELWVAKIDKKKLYESLVPVSAVP